MFHIFFSLSVHSSLKIHKIWWISDYTICLVSIHKFFHIN
nr:MAG TPA: hypothetical protein [Caudoviricetes sp.]